MKTLPRRKWAVGVLSVAAILPFAGTRAAEISWDNPGSGLFTNPENWSTDTVPTEMDNASILNGGTAQIQTGDEIAVSRLLITNGTVDQTGGSISTIPFGDFESPGAYEVGGVEGSVGNYNIAGASFLSGGRVRIGYAGGEGHVTIEGTSSYLGSEKQDTWVGNGAGSVGTLTMKGDSQWVIQNDWLVVGRNGGTGTLTMSEGSQMTINAGGNVVFGDGSGSNGVLNMSGSSRITNPDGVHFIFGNNGGSATGTLSGNAVVEIQNQVQIGNEGGNATLTITENAVLRSKDDWLVIGRNGGTANVTLESGLIERTGPSGGRHMIIADGGGANGTLTVNGGEVKSNSELWIGQHGTGKLVVNGGSVTTESWIAVGRDGASSGTLEIHGGSVSKNGDTNTHFVVNGATSFVLQTGGELNVNAGETWISEFSGKSAIWEATGGTANLGALTKLGVDGAATMTIKGTANYINKSVIVATNETSVAELNLEGGTFTADGISEGAGNGFVNLNGGVLRAGAANPDFLANFDDGDIAVQAGGLKFDTNNFNVGISYALSGEGGLTKLGTGTLTLTGATTFTGFSAVQGGVLEIGVGGVLAGVPHLDIAAGAGLVVHDAVSLNEEIVLTLVDGAALTLDFEGDMTIAALWINGEAITPDTYTLEELQALPGGVDFDGDVNATLTVTSTVPEPGTLALLGCGAAFAMWRLRRRR
jgi:PEP-CTERM putative exosortase interaction domain/autotransporter-associated beta strand repeat